MTWLINCIIGLFTKVAPRNSSLDFNDSLFNEIVWVCANRNKKNSEIKFSFEDIDFDMLDKALNPVLDYINNKYDCADFRYLKLLKLKFVANDLLEKYPELEAKIKNTLCGFKFWITSKGKDSMCYYTENHQLAFIACEYLAGQFYQEDIFTIDGKTGKEHQKEAFKRFTYWCELREKYSFSEFYSANYTPINLATLAMLLEYSNNKTIIKKSKHFVDIILEFFASTMFDFTYINASARDYPRNLMNSKIIEPNSQIIINAVWKDKNKANSSCKNTAWLFADMFINSDCYKIPKKIFDLAYQEEVEINRSFGLDLKDYKKENLDNLEDKSLMMQLGSGALTNPEVINNTYKLMHKHKNLWNNDFLFWLRFIESPLLRILNLMPSISKRINYFTNGMALQEGNIKVYRNKFFKLSVLNNYYPGSSGAQKCTLVATLPNEATIFTNNPLIDSSKKRFTLTRSPSYFGGYSIAPHAVSDRNIALIIYNIPLCRRVIQPHKMLHYTHTFFPIEKFDEYKLDGKYLFGRIENSLVAIIGHNDLEFKDFDEKVFEQNCTMLNDKSKPFDVIQKGRKVFWIYEFSNTEKENFIEFIKRIKSNSITFDKNKLVYNTNDNYELTYQGKFIKNRKELKQEFEK